MNKKLTRRFLGFTFIVLMMLVAELAAPFSASAIFVQSQKFDGSDTAASDVFGATTVMSADGTRMAVGATGAAGGNGAVYVYTLSGGSWTEEQKLTASDGASGDQLGYSLAISSDGSRVAIGAPGSGGGQGAVYVFSRSGTTWTQEQKLTASDGVAGDSFHSVGITDAGDRIIVGAHTKGSNNGAAYVFSRSGTVWTEEQKLTASDTAAGDFFGFGTAINSDGTRVIIGAQSANADKGAAYVFSRSGTVWTEEDILTTSDGVAGDAAGIDVAISSDATRVALGANGVSSARGAVYVFSRSGTVWTEEQKLTASNAAASDNFGSVNTLSFSEDATRLTVGAYGRGSNTGAAYVFSRSATTWTEEQELTASDAAASDYFGYSMSISGDGTLIGIGAAGVSSFAGAAYYYPFDTAPTLSTVSPTDGSTGVKLYSDLTLTFNEAVTVGTGNITIKKSSDDSTFVAIDVTSGNVTGSGTATITVNPTNDLNYSTGYYVQVDATAFDDSVGNGYAGIADTTTWNFTTEDAPVTSSGSRATRRTTVVVEPEPTTEDSGDNTPSASVCRPGDKFSFTTGKPCPAVGSSPVTPGTTNTPPSCEIKPLLRKSSTGEHVKCLQTALGIPSDGIFGPQTQNAVLEFQRSKSLLVDGLVGAETIKALGF